MVGNAVQSDFKGCLPGGKREAQLINALFQKQVVSSIAFRIVAKVHQSPLLFVTRSQWICFTGKHLLNAAGSVYVQIFLEVYGAG